MKDVEPPDDGAPGGVAPEAGGASGGPDEPARSPRQEAARAVMARIDAHFTNRFAPVFEELVELLVEASACEAHQYDGFSSPVDALVKRGYPESFARDAVGVAAAYQREPQVRAEVEALNVPYESAAILGRVFKNPAIAEKHDWIGLAHGVPPRELRAEFWDAVEEVTAGEPVERRTFRLTVKAKRDLKRCQTLLMRSRRRAVPEGEVVGVALGELAARLDPLENAEGTGTRRAPDTAKDLKSRYVPAAVKRELRRRYHDRCAVPGCSARTYLDAAHFFAHMLGSSRELDDLVLLCHRHNLMHAAGDLVIRGPPDAPEFYNRAGVRLTEVSGPGRL